MVISANIWKRFHGMGEMQNEDIADRDWQRLANVVGKRKEAVPPGYL